MPHTIDWLHHTKRLTLPNGLTILTHFLPNSEAAGLHFCVKAGYFCETDTEVGLAHLLEHMYFKGSENFPDPGTLGIRMKALGGNINATTSYDQTNYFCEVPAENLGPALQMMADAFVAPIFPADELKRECEVVIEEFNRKIDSPASYSQEKLIQMAYTTHRMKRWRIGTPEQLRSYTQESLFDYFHRYYQPQNMIVIVTGKFDEAQILNQIETLLSPLRNGAFSKDFGPAEPPQKELRYAMHKATGTQSFLHFGFHVAGVMDPDGPALEFLAFLLSAGRSARLHRHLVEQKRSASSASCGYAAYEDVGILLMSAVTEAAKIREAGRDLWIVTEDLLKNGITSCELKKVKNKLQLHQAMQTEEVLNLAEILSYYETYGGFERMEEYFGAMLELTEDAVVDVARKYLRLENLSALEFVNEDVPTLQTAAYKKHLMRGFVALEAILTPPLMLPSENGLGKAQLTLLPIIEKQDATYILHPDPHYPFVSAGIFFVGGRNEEHDSIGGITHLLLRAALKGTSQLNAEQLAFRFDALGNPPRFASYRDYSGFTFETLPESFLEAWNLLLHCITDCRFPQKEVETEKGKVLATILRNFDDNFIRPLQLFQRAFFGSHPYGIPEAGFEESVARFMSTDLADWKQRLFNRTRTIVAVVGNFDPEILLPRLHTGLSAFPSSDSTRKPPPPVSNPASREMMETRSKKQTAFVIGFPAPAATNPEVHKYEALEQVLGGMGGRLFLNLRSKKSLAYTVYAGSAASAYSGTFITYIAGEASKEKEALEGMWQELENLRNAPVSREELENARSAMIGNYVLNTQTAGSRAFDYANSFLLNRPIPFAPVYRTLVQNLSAEDLLEIARTTFRIENSTIGIVRGTTEITDAEKLIPA